MVSMVVTWWIVAFLPRVTRRGCKNEKLMLECTAMLANSSTFEFLLFISKLLCQSALSVIVCLTLKVLVTTIDAQWKGMGDVGSARYEPALLPPCPTIRILSYSN